MIHHDFDSSELIDALRERPDLDLVREMVGFLYQSLIDAEADLTSFADMSIDHWVKNWSTNPLELVNAEIKRRTRAVGIFPNDAAARRPITAVVVDQHDEWLVAERRYLSEESMT